MILVFCSDVLISKLKPVDPEPFDANRLIGFTAAHLGAVVKLLSIPNKPDCLSKTGDSQTSSEKELKIKEEEKATTDALMKKLDEDIARVIEQESEDDQEDHNADKRKAPLVSLETLDLDESSIASSVSSPRDEIPADDREEESESYSGKLPAVVQLDVKSPVREPEMEPELPPPSEEAEISEGSISVESEISEKKEFQTSYIQVTALKALHNIIWTNKFSEMLLVPKSDLAADSNKALIDGTVVRRNEDMKTILRLLMKKMVKVALSTSLLHKVFSLAELERAHTVLYKSLITSAAEEESCIAELHGKFKCFLCSEWKFLCL